MKRKLTITKLLVVLIGLMLTSCSTWHYNNPRVSVDKQKVIYSESTADVPTELSANPEEKVVAESKTEVRANVTEIKANEKVKTLSKKTAKSNLGKSNTPKSPALVNPSIEKSKSPFDRLVNLFKKPSEKVNKTNHVAKTELSGWVRIMVILFVVGFILLLIGIFLSVFIYGGFWWLFYTFGALCILAGFIILILGLVGLI